MFYSLLYRGESMGKDKDPKTKVVTRNIKAWQSQEALRNAEVAFITDRQRHSVEYWWQRLCADLIPLSAFVSRARRGEWNKRRDEYWNEVRQEVLRQSKYRAVQDRVKELAEITQLRADALEAISPKIVGGRKIYPVSPGSMEGMVGAVVKLDQLGDQKRNEILTMIEPDLIQEDGDQKNVVFSSDEMRSVAKMLLKKRREHQLEGLKNVGDKED